MFELNIEILKKALASLQYSPEKIENIIAIRNKTNITSKKDNWTKNRSGKLNQDPALMPKNLVIKSSTKNSLAKNLAKESLAYKSTSD